MGRGVVMLTKLAIKGEGLETFVRSVIQTLSVVSFIYSTLREAEAYIGRFD